MIAKMDTMRNSAVSIISVILKQIEDLYSFVHKASTESLQGHISPYNLKEQLCGNATEHSPGGSSYSQPLRLKITYNNPQNLKIRSNIHR